MLKKFFAHLFACAILSLLSLVVLPSQHAFADGEFKTTWKTDNAGVSTDHQITVPTYSGLTYDYTVDWGDGSSTSGLTGDATHTYLTPGTYQIMITGTFPGIFFSLAGDREKILSVDQWGTNHWGAMGNAFFGCSNLSIAASDTPDLSGIHDLTYTFRGTNFSAGLSDWDVSTVYTMIGTFQDSTFNGDISAWDMSHVNNISALFYNDTAFNQDISGWDTSSLTDMNYLFYHDTSFNQNINAWDVSHVTDLTGIFMGASAFNQPIDHWDVSHATNFTGLFYGASSFNQDISSWDTSSATILISVFQGATAFNQPLNTWDTSHVTHLLNTFRSATSFNQPLDRWNTGNAVNISYLFYGASSFNQDISSWDTSNVTTMNGVFAEDPVFNQPIGRWNVGHVTSMSDLFRNDTAFNQDLSHWNVGSVVVMSSLFRGAESFNQPIGTWNTSNVTDMSLLFASSTAFNQDISSWNTAHVTNMYAVFYGATAFDQDLSPWTVTHVTDMTNMLDGANMSHDHYNALLVSWSAQSLQSDVTFHAGTSTYCDAAAHDRLTTSPNRWTITDGGVRCITATTPLASYSTITNTVFRFHTSESVESAYASRTGSYSLGTPSCAECSVHFDPVEHTITFENLRVGDVLDFSLVFTGTNTLRIGPCIIIAQGGGATAQSSVRPTALPSSSPLSFLVNGGNATTTTPLLQLTLNGDPKTIRGYIVSLDPTFAHDGILPFDANTKTPLFRCPTHPEPTQSLSDTIRSLANTQNSFLSA